MNSKPIYDICTIGHSVKPIEIFIEKLKENSIDILVDVRTTPFSRWMPQYNKLTLERTLKDEGIYYLYRGKSLGGKGVNVGWDEAIEELVVLAEKGERVAVMCSEGDYRKCHRYTTITPALENAGIRVVHTEYANEKEIAKSHK